MLRRRPPPPTNTTKEAPEKSQNVSQLLIRGAAFTWRWRLYLVLVGIWALCLYALATTSLVEWSGTNRLAHSTASLVSALRASVIRLNDQQRVQLAAACDRILQMNATLTLDILLLMDALNMTRSDGQSFQQDIEARLDALEFLASLKLESVNGVLFNNMTFNIGLMGDGSNEIITTPQPASYALNISNGAILELTSPDGSFNITEIFLSGLNTFQMTTNALLTMNSVSPTPSANLELLGTGMIVIQANVNTSTITIDGSMLEMALLNLQTQADTQWMQIDALQVAVINIQNQLDAIQVTADDVQALLTNTILSTNMTLTQLIANVMQLQIDVAEQEAYVQSLASNTSIPVGTILPWANNDTIPIGYLLCDGTQYNTSEYPALYDVLGTAYCNGMCSMGGFSVPDMRGRVAVAKGGGAAFSVSIGMNVGAETHAVTLSELPAHGHTGTTFSAGTHAHSWTIYSTPSGNAFSLGPDLNPAGSNYFRQSARFSISVFPPDPNNYCLIDMYSDYDVTGGTTPPYNGLHSHSFTTYNMGGSEAHANVQPTLVTQYIVKT